MTGFTAAIITAFSLDLVLGDPRWLPHPVKGIGKLINLLEPTFRRYVENERISGIFFAVTIIGSAWSAVYFFTLLAARIHYCAGFLLSVFFLYASFSVKDLKDESMSVYQALEKKDIVAAREKVRFIVGRDTRHMDEQEIIRATVETIAENTVDGIIAPLFYAFLGGAPLALAYKAVNTLDSIVGYKNAAYKYFGWASAKIDDAANFIPARLSALILPCASLCLGKNAFRSVRTILRDGNKNPSPNSGIPEAAVAGALGVQLGGMNFYNSVPVLKPLTGDKLHPLDKKHIKESIRIAYLVSLLFLILGMMCIMLLF